MITSWDELGSSAAAEAKHCWFVGIEPHEHVLSVVDTLRTELGWEFPMSAQDALLQALDREYWLQCPPPPPFTGA